MNRHHFALFIRNCRLILLLRREFGDGDLKSFRPAEFRWKLPQVMDWLPDDPPSTLIDPNLPRLGVRWPMASLCRLDGIP